MPEHNVKKSAAGTANKDTIRPATTPRLGIQPVQGLEVIDLLSTAPRGVSNEMFSLASLLQKGILSPEEFESITRRIVDFENNAFGNSGDHSFLELIVAGDINEIKRRIEAAPGVLRTITGANCWTPLHIAVSAGRDEIAELLLTRGADPNAESKRGKTPLHIAAKKGNTDIATMLLAHGADPAVVYNDRTPLEIAGEADHESTAQVLRKAEPNQSKPCERRH